VEQNIHPGATGILWTIRSKQIKVLQRVSFPELLDKFTETVNKQHRIKKIQSSARERCKCVIQVGYFTAYRKSFGRSSESDTTSFLQLFPYVFGTAAKSANSWANKLKTKSTQIRACAGNCLYCCPHVARISTDVHILSLGYSIPEAWTLVSRERYLGDFHEDVQS
jgi:hypothetical protein